MNANIVKGLGVALEITGTQLSDAAVRVIALELGTYPEAQVLGALKRCCKELKGRLTLAEIVSRMDDGRPGPEEAWSMIPRDEASSAFWTEEMREAYGACANLIREGQLVPARMAFTERYRVLVAQARDRREPVRWSPTLGTDRDGRELVILDAVQKGRISADSAKALLPYHRADEGLNARLLALAGDAVKRLEVKA